MKPGGGMCLMGISKCRALGWSVEERPVWPELGRYQGEGRTMRAEL